MMNSKLICHKISRIFHDYRPFSHSFPDLFYFWNNQGTGNNFDMRDTWIIYLEAMLKRYFDNPSNGYQMAKLKILLQAMPLEEAIHHLIEDELDYQYKDHS